MAEHPLHIKSPNLRTARTITVIAAVLQLFLSPLLMNNILGVGWVLEIRLLQVVIALIHAWAYFLFCEYLRNFNLHRTMVIVYVLAGCLLAASLIPHMIEYLMPYRVTYLVSFISAGISILNLAAIAMLYIAGISLFRFEEDVVGGMSLTGKLFTVKATVSIFLIMSYLYFIFKASKLRYDANDTLHYMSASVNILGTIYIVLNISILASFYRIYNMAEEYEMYADYDDDSDIMNDIDNIGLK